MAIAVPLWFYEFGSAMYVIASIVGVLLSYYSFKLFSLTSKRQHMLLHSAFIFITFGFLALSIGNVYSYFNFESCQPQCRIDPTDPTYFWIRFGNYGYYFTTLVGYSLLALSYFKTTKGKFFFGVAPPSISLFFQFEGASSVLYPFTNYYFQAFHALSIIILSYIVMQTAANYFKTKSMYSLLVFAGFAFIVIYHVLMSLAPFRPALFTLAHLSLLAGFSSLLIMLVQVNRK